MVHYSTFEEYERAVKGLPPAGAGVAAEEIPTPDRETALLESARIQRAYEDIARERRAELADAGVRDAVIERNVRVGGKIALVVLPVGVLVLWTIWTVLHG